MYIDYTTASESVMDSVSLVIYRQKCCKLHLSFPNICKKNYPVQNVGSTRLYGMVDDWKCWLLLTNKVILDKGRCVAMHQSTRHTDPS